MPANKLLTDQELSMLLETTNNPSAKTLSGLFINNQQANEIVSAIKNALLQKYKIIADMSVISNDQPRPSRYICSQITYNNAEAKLFMSSDFAGAIIDMALRNPTSDHRPVDNLTPVTTSLLQEICSTIWQAVSLIIAPDISWLQSPLAVIDQPVPSSNLCFQLDSGQRFWLQYPGNISASQNKKANMDSLNIPLELSAVVNEKNISLNELAELKPGAFMPLGIAKNNEISILLGNRTIFKGRLGQQFNKIAVKITEKDADNDKS